MDSSPFLSVVTPYLDDQMSMDLIHARMIGEYIRRSGVRHVVEVGCCWGVSTAVILESLSWWGDKASYVGIDPDIKPTVKVLAALASQRGVNVSLLAEKSLDGALSRSLKPGGLVLLDGDHSVDTVTAEVAVCRGVEFGYPDPMVVLHDCGRGAAGCEGPRGAFVYAGGGAIHDESIAGMRTDRGLGFIGDHDRQNELADECIHDVLCVARAWID